MAILHQEIPDPLHRQLKMEAASRSVTLKDLITVLLASGIAQLDVLKEDQQHLEALRQAATNSKETVR